jgi:hypothetical protein
VADQADAIAFLDRQRDAGQRLDHDAVVVAPSALH